jgi:hypothetical protein
MRFAHSQEEWGVVDTDRLAGYADIWNALNPIRLDAYEKIGTSIHCAAEQ